MFFLISIFLCFALVPKLVPRTVDFHWYWYRILKFWYRDNPTLLNYPLLSAVYREPRSQATKLLTWTEIQMYYFSSTPFSPINALNTMQIPCFVCSSTAYCLQPLAFIILRCFVQRPEHLNYHWSEFYSTPSEDLSWKENWNFIAQWVMQGTENAKVVGSIPRKHIY